MKKLQRKEVININIAKDLNTGEWTCLCSNSPMLDGFYPCNSEGDKVEPTPEEWNGITYVCDRCGKIINQRTLKIIGQAFLINGEVQHAS